MAHSRLAEFVHCARTLGDTPSQQVRILWRLTKNLRVRLGLARHNPTAVYQLTTIFGALWLRDNFGDITNLPGLLARGVYQWRELTGPGLILDVGANIGLAARWFARFNPGRAIVCCEPLPENIEMIRRNCPQAQVVAAAIGDGPGSVDLLTDADGVIASSIPTAWNSAKRTFPVRTLDDCAAEFGWGEVAVLKMDAEGMEPAILRGGCRLLNRTARVAAETHGRAGHDEVQALLREAGFRITKQRFGTHTGMVFAERSV
ncbi:MAG: FkbM family methyltransferase [Acidobacteria bacterium]|nr:FkbM family methyltransferase [Acidobacteriota bacterium]